MKKLASSISAMSWEIPWLSAYRWYRNKASVPMMLGDTLDAKGDPSMSLKVPGSGRIKEPNLTVSMPKE